MSTFSLNPLFSAYFKIHPSNKNSPLIVLFTGLLQFALAIYGGFFGGGSGILMLAIFSTIGMKNIHSMNALKTFLNACINGVAAIAFIYAGTIAWQQAILMSCGSMLGGYWGVRYARKLEPNLVRGFVMLVGFSMTCYFFTKPAR